MLPTHEQIQDTIKKSKRVLLTCRADAHVDSVASCLSLHLMLQKLGISSDVVLASSNHVLRQVKFLPATDTITVDGTHLRHLVIRLHRPGTKVKNFSYDMDGDTLNIYITPALGKFEPGDVRAEIGLKAYDLIITLDTPDLASLGDLYKDHADFFYKTPIINIDHDPGNEQYGQINHVDITSVSTTEILFRLFQALGDEHIDADVATTLLAGMVSKTQSFKTPTVTPRSLMVASELVQRGARRDEIIHHLYRQHDLATLRLWGRVLARLQQDPERQFVWSMVKREDFEKSGAGEEHLPGMIDELITTTPDAKTIAVLYQRTDGKIAGWLKTEHHTNALDMTRAWEPTGSKSLAHFILPSATIDDGLKEVQAVVAKIPGRK